MKKRYNSQIIIISLLSLIILTGCNQTQQQQVYYTGYDGVIMDFLKTNPTESHEEETTYLAFLVKNLGPTPITDDNPAKISVTYDTKYIELTEYNSEVDYENLVLEERGQSNPLGGQEYLEFAFKSKKFDTSRESVETGILFSLCYPYSIILSTSVCIDGQKNLIESKSSICKPTTFSGSGGQGGPLVITRIVPKATSSAEFIRPEFEIYVENRGKGYALNNNGEEYFCDFNAITKKSINDFNKITINAKLYEDELECMPQELRLVDGESYVRCYVSSENVKKYPKGQTSYTSILTVELNYGYIQTEKKTMTIKRWDDYTLNNFVTELDCGQYQIKDSTGKCIEKCEFCASNPTNKECLVNKPTENFSFDSSFECKCGRETCIQKTKTGECIFGYCTGSSYCCKN